MSKNRFSYMDLVLFSVAIMWGVNTAVMKIGYRYIPPFPFNAIRLLIAVIFAWSVVFLTRSYRKVEREDFKRLFSVCFVAFPVLQVCLSAGTYITPAGTASLILAMVPISVVIINKIFNIEKITAQSVMGVISSFVGVLFIVIGSGKSMDISGGSIMGIVYLLGTQFCFGYYMVFSKSLLEKYSIYQMTAYASTGSALLLFIFYNKSILQVDWASVTAGGWMSSLYAGIIGMCVGNFIWSLGVKKVGSTRTALYNNLPPVFTILIGYFFLGEQLSFMLFFGAFFIFAGLYITRFKARDSRVEVAAGESRNL